MKEFIKSPLNYTGNKYRILSQITEYFPQESKNMIDLFCGGATVGINSNSEKVVFVDNNERVINLLVYISKQDFDTFLVKCEQIIFKYNLSYSYKFGYKKFRELCSDHNDNNGLKDYNSEGFYKLRDDYNKIEDKSTDEANQMLYILMVYGFNNDIRFNSFGDFNLPVGKTDLNKNNVSKISKYIERVNSMNCEFINMSFQDEKFVEYIDKADFCYMDPPYLLTTAVYNSSWSYEQEHELLDFIDTLLNKKINFALSNILEKGNLVNEPLAYWIHKHSNEVEVIDIDYNYKSASYNKKSRSAKEREVLVVNKRY